MSPPPADPAGIEGIVLAGGRSSRFGRDKLREPLGGRPLLDGAILGIAARCSAIIVVVAPGAVVDLPADARVPVRIVPDRVAFDGPLAGLAAGLEAAAASIVLVAGGDMPDLRADVLALLADRLAADASIDAVALHDGDRRQPLPVALRVVVAGPVAERLLEDGERSLGALLRALRTVDVAPAEWHRLDPDAATLRDVDRPSDLPLGRDDRVNPRRT